VKSRPGWLASREDVDVYEEASREGAPPKALVSKNKALLYLDSVRTEAYQGIIDCVYISPQVLVYNA